MITLFHAPRTRSQKVMWMLEEMGVAYEVRAVSFLERDGDEEFAALNPAGFLPVMKDGDTVLLESRAMMEYIAARYGPTPLVPGPTDQTYPAYLQYFHFGEASLAAPLMVIPYSFISPRPNTETTTGQKSRARSFVAACPWSNSVWRRRPIWRARTLRPPISPSPMGSVSESGARRLTL